MTDELKFDLTIDIEKPFGQDFNKTRCANASGVRALIGEQLYFAQDEGGHLYYYREGAYYRNGHKAIALAAKQIWDHLFGKGNGQYSNAKVQDMVHYFSVDAPPLLAKPADHIINLKNGLYDVRRGVLDPHNPLYRTTVQLNVAFDAMASCPAWDKFISEVLEQDSKVAYEIVAWLMTPFTSSQKSVVLLGTGANGKSVYLNGIETFLGANNYCNIPMQKLSDRFTTIQLIGKLANISPDLPNVKLTSTSEFKSLTGGDTMLGEYKHGDSFSFKPFARCLFACNELPETPDNSDGFYRRLNVITFEKQFKDDPAKGAILKASLTSSTELSGLLNKALEVLPKVLSEGITITENMIKVLEDHRKENDPVSVWFDEYTVESQIDETGKVLSEHFIPMTELYQAYRASGNGGQAAKSAIAFGRSLKRYRPRVVKQQKRIEGLVTWVYLGIRLKSEFEEMTAEDWQSSDDLEGVIN